MDAESNLKTNKKRSDRVKSILIVAVLIALAAGAYLLIKKGNNEPRAYQLKGHFVSAQGNTVTVLGVYADTDGKVVDPTIQPKEVKVEVTDKTVINRESFKVPVTTGVFYPDKLTTEKTTASLSQLLQDSSSGQLGVVVTADSNIFNKDNFIASSITYRVAIQ